MTQKKRTPKKNNPTYDPERCGKIAGSSRHRRMGEYLCEACLEADRTRKSSSPERIRPPRPGVVAPYAEGFGPDDGATPPQPERKPRPVKKKRSLRTPPRPPRKAPPCGTVSGFNFHLKQRKSPCPECIKAKLAADAEAKTGQE